MFVKNQNVAVAVVISSNTYDAMQYYYLNKYLPLLAIIRKTGVNGV